MRQDVVFHKETAIVTYNDAATDVKALIAATTNAAYLIRPRPRADSNAS